MFFFGIIGIIFAIITAIQITQEGKLTWEFFTERSGYMAVFAISLLTDLYAYSRIDREAAFRDYVKRRSFDQAMTAEEPDELFNRILADQKSQMVEVSESLDRKTMLAVEKAWMLVQNIKQGAVEPIHVFGTLIPYPEIQMLLARLGIPAKILTEKVARAIQRYPQKDFKKVGLSRDMKQALLAAYREAYLTRQRKVGVPQLFTAIVLQGGIAEEILYDMAVEKHQVANVTEWLNIRKLRIERLHHWRSRASHKPAGAVNRSYTSLQTQLLDRFSHDLTSVALRGALPMTVGREKELEELFRIIESGKGNPLLVGNPGVGKQGIVEAIATLMASEEVPEVLQDKRLISLSVASLVGSSGRQGELEGRLIQLINEIVRAGNIVLVIDNIQNMVGVSTEGAENLDIADILAQALEKRLFVCVASTTPQDYRKYVETSGSLMRVFQRVDVGEPDENETIRILESKVDVVEYKNDIFFSYKALENIVRLTDRYIHDRFQPSKAIGILEETAVHVRKKKGKKSLATAEDVAEVISSRTNVPVTRVTEKESEKLLNLEEQIHERIVGQDEAVKAVSTALRRARAELRDIKRPIANLMFLGPTGVGKTELAKTVAAVYYGSEETMIRLDMTEYQEQASINRLIGAPPGYRGESEGGHLTEAIRNNPFSLLLLDELEKAHPDIINVFLQVMDDGRLTDTYGRTIDFTNTIIIATSNAGSLRIQEGIQQNQSIEQIKDVLINEELNKHFRPEFLNRFDNIVVFKPLAFEEIVQITGLMLNQVAKRLSVKGITLQASKEAMEELARTGFDPKFGARPLRRAIQEQVDNALANHLLRGKIGRRDIAVLEPGGKIRVEQAREL
ncbi:AAA family ATPase [Patescibacteria group bacterium]